MAQRHSLTNDLQALLKRACKEGDLEVAEYLLQALEAIARRSESDENLDQVYSQLARYLDKRWHGH